MKTEAELDKIINFIKNPTIGTYNGIDIEYAQKATTDELSTLLDTICKLSVEVAMVQLKIAELEVTMQKCKCCGQNVPDMIQVPGYIWDFETNKWVEIKKTKEKKHGKKESC